jgi:hypothetical protein
MGEILLKSGRAGRRNISIASEIRGAQPPARNTARFRTEI